MRTAFNRAAFLLALTVSVIGVASSPFAASSAAEAKRGLETALADLAKAIRRAEKDPPTPEDLKAAEAAVNALGKVIDAGAAHEAQDLEYAKAALAARKELRRTREYVEQRVANMELHEQRRGIDRALGGLESALSAVRGGSPDAAAFDRAHKATAALAQILEKSKRLEKREASFDAHLRDSREKLAKAEDEISQAETRVQVASQTSALDGLRKKLDAALGPLAAATVTDAQFDTAERAATELEKSLEFGSALEGRDKNYGKLASGHRTAAKQARKTIETRWGEAGLNRLKAELEPPHQDLRNAARWLSNKNPGAERIAEANTAAIVVAKLLERSAHLSARSSAVRSYLAEVERTLVGVQVDLQKRRIEPVRAKANNSLKKVNYGRPEEKDFLEAEHDAQALNQLLREGEALEKKDRGYGSLANELRKWIAETSARITARRAEMQITTERASIEKARSDLARSLLPLERRSPDRARFDEAGTAAIVLEKTLEAASGIKDRDFQKHVAEMRSLLVLSRRKIEERRLAVEIEAQQAKVEAGRREVDGAMKQIFARNVPDERLGQVETAVAKARKILDDGRALTEKDSKYAVYDREVRKRLDETLVRLATRRDELGMQSQQARATAGLSLLEKSMAAIDRAADKTPAVAAADDAYNAARTDIEAGAELEKKLSAYRSWAAGARRTLEIVRLRLAKKKVEIAVAEAKANIEGQLVAFKAALLAASRPASTPTELETAEKAEKAARAAIDAARPLETQSSAHERLVQKVSAELDTRAGELALAARAQAFRRTVVTALEAGTAAAQDAAETKSPQLAKDEYQKAVNAFRDCLSRAESEIEAEPRLASFAVLVERAETTAKEVLALCKTRHDGAADGLRQVSGIVALREGPIKAYEAAKALMGKADASSGDDKKRFTTQALAQFEECISSGKIVRYKNPELESEEIVVLGKKTTLVQLIDECTKTSKSLRAK